MKIGLRTVLLVVLLSAAGFTERSFATSARTVSLQWQGSTDTRVAGYALYYGLSGSSATNRLDVGMTTTANLGNLTASSSYYFFVVAYDSYHQESDPSNFLTYAPSAMSSLQVAQSVDGAINLSFYVAPQGSCHVEYTDSLNPPSWNLLTNAVGDANGLITISDPIVPGQTRFYRAVVP